MGLIDYKTTEIKKNVVLKEVMTSKYKDFNIYFSFLLDLSRKEKVCMSLIKEQIGLTSEKRPSKKDMVRSRNLLYGASVEAAVSVFSYKSCLRVNYNFVDPKYLTDVDWNDYFEFITDTLFHPILNEETVRENIKILKNYISRKLDKPSIYADNRVYQILSKQENRFEILDHDYIEILDSITLEDVLHTYRKILDESMIEIVTVGDSNPAFMEPLKNLPFNERDPYFKTYDEAKLSDVNLIEESKNTSQTALVTVYKMNQHDLYTGKNYYSVFLGNAMLGIFPCSLLFSEVREKRSLCYTINSENNKKDGLLTILTLISYKNKEAVIEEIDRQIHRLMEGDYPDDTLTTSKRLLIDSLVQSLDNADSIYNYLHSRGFYSNESFEEMLEGIESVTREDLSQCFRDTRHILTYVLKGNEEENK